MNIHISAILLITAITTTATVTLCLTQSHAETAVIADGLPEKEVAEKNEAALDGSHTKTVSLPRNHTAGRGSSIRRGR